MWHSNPKPLFKHHRAFFLTMIGVLFSASASSVLALELEMSTNLSNGKQAASQPSFSGLFSGGSRIKQFAYNALNEAKFNLPTLTSKITSIGPQNLVSGVRVADDGSRIDFPLDSKGSLVVANLGQQEKYSKGADPRLSNQGSAIHFVRRINNGMSFFVGMESTDSITNESVSSFGILYSLD